MGHQFIYAVFEQCFGPLVQTYFEVGMLLGTEPGGEHLAGVFHGMIEVHDLSGAGEVLAAHALQALGPIDEEHHVSGITHATTQGLSAQHGRKLVDRAEV